MLKIMIWPAVLLTMLVWGNASFAGVQGQPMDSQELKAWMEHLNYWVPDLEVDAAQNLGDPEVRLNVEKELEKLEDYLNANETGINDGELKQLACGRPVCDGGDPNYSK